MLEELYPYQHVGANWLATKDQALLADSMGLGKSAQAVRASDLVGAFNILVVCPASVRVNWSREFDRFSPMDRPCTVIATGKDKPAAGVNVISFDLLASNEKMRTVLKNMQWDALVIDEAHYLKERAAKRTRALYGHNKFPGIMHSAKRTWRLSGTPAPNNASELYTHMRSAGVVKQSYWDFVFEFCNGFDSSFGFKITGTKNADKLKALLGQFMMRRKKEDVLKELPEIVFQNVTVERGEVELDPWFYENWRPIGVPAFLAQMKDIDTNLKNALMTLKHSSHYVAEDAITLLESFSKSTSTLRRYIGMAKVARACDVLEEDLASGAIDKIVVFCVHQQVIEQVRLRLLKFHPVTLFGGTPAEKRQRHIDRFQRDPSCKVFVGQIQAAGTGITLTAAHEVAFIESSWVPADNAQAAMRCHRIGQTKPVRVRFFNCAGSVDEEVTRVLYVKTREIAKFMD